MWSSRRFVMFACGIGAAILGSSVLLTAAPDDKADKASPQSEAALSPAQQEVVAAIEAYNKAVAQKNIDQAMAAFVPGPDTTVLGTGPGETWRGPEEIREAHLKFFESFEKESCTPVWRYIQVDGDVAWVAAQSRFVDELKGKKNEFVMNISGVFQKNGGKWRIALLHVSNVTGPEKQAG